MIRIDSTGEINSSYKTATTHTLPTLYLLAVLQDALLGADAALGARGVRLPLAALHVDVHVEFTAKHGHLGLCQQTHRHIRRHLGVSRDRRERERERDLMRYTTHVKLLEHLR